MTGGRRSNTKATMHRYLLIMAIPTAALFRGLDGLNATVTATLKGFGVDSGSTPLMSEVPTVIETDRPLNPDEQAGLKAALESQYSRLGATTKQFVYLGNTELLDGGGSPTPGDSAPATPSATPPPGGWPPAEEPSSGVPDSSITGDSSGQAPPVEQVTDAQPPEPAPTPEPQQEPEQTSTQPEPEPQPATN
jgi:hypothetical protein